jgi:uncharacterized protein YcbK (DUF882 family)
MWRSVAVASLALVLSLGNGPGFASDFPRFFISGTGKLAVVNAHSDEKVAVTYRRPDGSYDRAALDQLRHVFRSSGDARETTMALRLVEVLSRVQQLAGGKPLVLLSGYRSPEYNESIRAKGAKAAAGSLHTEGLAADIAPPRPLLLGLWKKIRDLDCCGAGYYAQDGFLHVDVGRPRFWEPATSRVEENLSASNARLFARSEFDRYRRDEEMVVSVYSLTVPPVRIARTARLESDGGATIPLRVGDDGEAGTCFTLDASGAALRVAGVKDAARGRLVLATCEPREGRTPETVETNPIEVR